MTSSGCLRRHLACASQLLLFCPRTRASLILLIQMELVLHGYQRKIFLTMQKNLRKQALLEDLTTTGAWTGMCLLVSQQFWFCIFLYWCNQSFTIQQFPVFYLPWDNWNSVHVWLVQCYLFDWSNVCLRACITHMNALCIYVFLEGKTKIVSSSRHIFDTGLQVLRNNFIYTTFVNKSCLRVFRE